MAKKENAMLEELAGDVVDAPVKKARPTVVDCIPEDKYARYQTIVADAAEWLKANAPKKVRVKKEQTKEDAIKAKQAKAAKLQAEIEAMLAEQNTQSTI